METPVVRFLQRKAHHHIVHGLLAGSQPAHDERKTAEKVAAKKAAAEAKKAAAAAAGAPGADNCFNTPRIVAESSPGAK